MPSTALAAAGTKYPLLCEQAWSLSAGRDVDSDGIAAYRVPRLDLDRLAQWLEDTIRRHDALRLQITEGESSPAMTFTAAPPPVQVPVLTIPEGCSQDRTVRALARRLFAEPARREQGAFRVAAARAPGGAGYVAFTADRTLVDDLSFIRLREAFGGAFSGSKAGDEEAGGSYEDYVRATAGTRPARVERNTKWWIEQIGRIDAGAFESGAGLLDRSGAPTRAPVEEVTRTVVQLPPARRVDLAAARYKITIPALLLGSSAGALAAATATPTLLFLVAGTPGRTRRHARTVGNFVVPMHLALTSSGDARDDAGAAAQTMMEGLLHAPYQFGEWAAAYRNHVTAIARPAAISSFLYEADQFHRPEREDGAAGAPGPNQESPDDEAGPVRLLPDPRRTMVPPNYLEFQFEIRGSRLALSVNYAAASYRPQFVARIAEDIARRVSVICS